MLFSKNSQRNLKHRQLAANLGKMGKERPLAPRAGLEPATLRLQLPPNFFGDWTISSP